MKGWWIACRHREAAQGDTSAARRHEAAACARHAALQPAGLAGALQTHELNQKKH